MAITLDGSTGITDANGGTVLNTTATQTVTNKTLTSPTITGATITGSTVSGGTIVQGTAQASTSGANIDFTGIPSWVKRVTVMFSGISTTGTSNTMLQLGTSSGITASGYLGASGFSSTGSGATNFTTGFGLSTSTSAATIFYAVMTVANVTGNTWVASVAGGYSNAASSLQGGGSVTLSGTLDRVRLTTVAGTDTFDAGSINIMYEG
jgi:hypothetical protein